MRRSIVFVAWALLSSGSDLAIAQSATANAQTVYAYDALDRLTGVGDADGLNTVYSYDGLGNTTSQQSPDTGVTSYTNDAAGNRLTETDARGVTATYSYDALNRRTGIIFTDATQNVTYAYDEANSVTGCANSFPIGHLTRVIEGDGKVTALCYDQMGRVVSKQLTVAGTSATTTYGYTPGGRLQSITYPSGTQVSYLRNAAGLVSGINLTPAGSGSSLPVVTGITYQPFGEVASYTLGSGQTVTRTFDANSRITGVSSAVMNLQLTRDASGRVTALTGTNSESYTYDALQRLTGVKDATGAAIEAYTYSKAGDRLSKTGGLFATGTYSYATGTHLLTCTGTATRTYDAAGHMVTSQIGGSQFVYRYNARGRLESANRDGQDVATYTYNASGLRVRKVVTFPTPADVRFGYDEQAHLLTEQSASGSRDYIWLAGLPVAVVDTTGASSTVSYIHADALGSPRVVTDATGVVRWQWSYAGNPFGEQQPTSSNGFVLNLRFPGQYFDSESGLAYNIHRDYDAPSGRYAQPDPTGLDGGINLFPYVSNNPLNSIDPLGLQDTTVDAYCARYGAAACAEAVGGKTGAGISAGTATAIGAGVATGVGAGVLSQSCPKNNGPDCYDRFEKEAHRCMRWEGKGPADDPNRWARACVERAAYRRSLCIKGIEDEPEPWSIDDLK